MAKKNDSERSVAKWHRELQSIQRKLARMYQKGKPDPRKMPAYKVSAEWELLMELVGTKFLTAPLRARWLKIDREHSSMAARTAALPY